MQKFNLYARHTIIMQYWKKLESQEGEPCPVGRGYHAAVCLQYGDDHPHLLVTGGVDNDGTTLTDAWMLDIQSGRWREVRIYH